MLKIKEGTDLQLTIQTDGCRNMDDVMDRITEKVKGNYTFEPKLTEFEQILADEIEGNFPCAILDVQSIKKVAKVLMRAAYKTKKSCGGIIAMAKTHYYVELSTARHEGYERGKKEALDSVPKWKRVPMDGSYCTGYSFTTEGVRNKGYEINLNELWEKLPKED